MQIIIRGTTPVFKYTFSEVAISDITVAYLTIKSGNTTVEKTLSDATIGDDYLQWQLSQEETISLGRDAVARLNWKKEDGTRGASNRVSLTIEENEKEGVI